MSNLSLLPVSFFRNTLRKTAYHPLPTAYCPPPTVHCALPTANCPLPTACCLLLTVCCLLLNLSRLPAQLPAGVTAPDFTAADVTGQTWHLYDLLADDKIVLLNFSATWCGPCWAYHNGGALQDLYAAHGPDGDDRLRILHIEGDPATNLNCLYGNADCNSFSPGNWIAGTLYPVFDNAFVAANYGVTYYPTLYVVCPNKKLYEVKPLDAPALWAAATTCPVAYGVNNAGIFDAQTGTPFHEICDQTLLTPAFQLINLGSSPLTSALLKLQWNGQTVQTQNWTGNLDLYSEAAIHFQPLPVSTAGTLTMQVSAVNAADPDDEPANNLHSDIFALAANNATTQSLLKIHTDDFGAETYWELRNENGQVLDAGGNTDVGPNGGGHFPGSISGGPGAYGNNVTINHLLNLPASGCYSLHFVDAYGDGMCCEFGAGYYKLYDSNAQTNLLLSGGDFADYDRHLFGVGTATSIQPPSDAVVPFMLPTNPISNTFYLGIALSKPTIVHAQILNNLGRTVYRFPNSVPIPAGEYQWKVAVSDWPPGVYFFQGEAGGQRVVRQVILTH